MAKDIFEQNKSLDVAYKTSDGVFFYTENNAQNHAKTLKNKKVTKVVRSQKKTTQAPAETKPADDTKN